MYDYNDMKRAAKINAYLKVLESIPDDDKVKFAEFVRDDLLSYSAFLDMADITAMIDDFFNGLIPMYEIKQKIISLPKSRLLHTKLDDVETIEKNYWQRVYHFAAYLAYIDDYSILDNFEVSLNVRKLAAKDIEELQKDLTIPTKVFNRLINIKDGYAMDKEDLHQVLKDIYGLKSKQDEYLIPLDMPVDVVKKYNEIEVLKAKLNTEEKELKVLKARKAKQAIKLFIATLSIPAIIFGHRNTVMNGRDEGGFWASTVIESEDGPHVNENTHYHTTVGIDGYLDTLNNDYLDTERRYVTVFSDTVDDVANIKLYDYTDSNITDEELKTIELDDKYLVLDQNINVSTLEGVKNDSYVRNGVKEGMIIEDFGVYTGNAHRDVARVKYGWDPRILVIICPFLFGIIALFGTEGLSIASGDVKEQIESNEKLLEEIENKKIEIIDFLEKSYNEKYKAMAQQIKQIPTQNILDSVFTMNNKINSNANEPKTI